MLDTCIHGIRNMQNPIWILLFHHSKQDTKEAGGGFTYLIFHFSNWLTICRQFSWNKYSQSTLALIVQTGFSKEKCLPWLKRHPLDVLIDRSQKVIQMASSNNMHKLKVSSFCPLLLQNLVYRRLHHTLNIIYCNAQIHLFHSYYWFVTSCLEGYTLLLSPVILKLPAAMRWAMAEPHVCPWPKYSICVPHSEFSFS